MPNRPRSHQVSDESRRAFETALPGQWVPRVQQPDYGIDEEVEIFDEAGLICQLLAFDSELLLDDVFDLVRIVGHLTDFLVLCG